MNSKREAIILEIASLLEAHLLSAISSQDIQSEVMFFHYFDEIKI